MEDADQIAALILFTTVGGSVGALITKGDQWRGALATFASLVIVGVAFAVAGSGNIDLMALAAAFSVTAICGALRMKPLQIGSTLLGAYAGWTLVRAFFFWTSVAT